VSDPLPPPAASPIEPAAASLPAGPRRSRVLRTFLGIGVLLVLLVAWHVLTSYVAYTDDAYVRSHAGVEYRILRSSEIALGTSVALLIARWLLPAGPATGAIAPGWSSAFDPRGSVLGYACRAGVSIALVPAIWRALELPNLSQMAISIGALMAVPVLTGSDKENRRLVAHRSAQRLAGCLLGGTLGLLVLRTGWSAFLLVWLSLMMIGAAVGVQLETGRHGVKIIGIQAEVALILTLTQGWGPATLLEPALDRVGGMVGAILLLYAVNWIFGPIGRAPQCGLAPNRDGVLRVTRCLRGLAHRIEKRGAVCKARRAGACVLHGRILVLLACREHGK